MPTETFNIEIMTDTLGKDADECDSNIAKLLMEVADSLVDSNRGLIPNKVELKHRGKTIGHWGYG